VAAYLLFPQRDQLPTPPYVAVNITALDGTLGSITYDVDRTSTSTADITVTVHRLPRATTPATVRMVVFLPLDAEPVDCTHCSKPGEDANIWAPPLEFDGDGRTSATVHVRADGFGYTENGLSASVAIPQLTYVGRGEPGVSVSYDLPGARDYDWSSFPTAFADDTSARWTHQLNGGRAAARNAVGVNHTNQDKDNRNTFLAGALVGLAGGALLAAVQEGLHTTK
jgi:hypothetical protein